MIAQPRATSHWQGSGARRGWEVSKVTQDFQDGTLQLKKALGVSPVPILCHYPCFSDS